MKVHFVFIRMVLSIFRMQLLLKKGNEKENHGNQSQETKATPGSGPTPPPKTLFSGCKFCFKKAVKVHFVLIRMVFVYFPDASFV